MIAAISEDLAASTCQLSDHCPLLVFGDHAPSRLMYRRFDFCCRGQDHQTFPRRDAFLPQVSCTTCSADASDLASNKGVLSPIINDLSDSFSSVYHHETEQDRIVAEIEKQFTRLDAAVAALKRVQAT